MSEQTVRGAYVYQPFGTCTHPERATTGRLYGVGNLPLWAKCEGLTREEAHAVANALNLLWWTTDDVKGDGTGEP